MLELGACATVPTVPTSALLLGFVDESTSIVNPPRKIGTGRVDCETVLSTGAPRHAFVPPFEPGKGTMRVACLPDTNSLGKDASLIG